MEKPKITYDTLINFLTDMENAADLQLVIASKNGHKAIKTIYETAICQSVVSCFFSQIEDKSLIEDLIKDIEEAYSQIYDPMWEKIDEQECESSRTEA